MKVLHFTFILICITFVIGVNWSIFTLLQVTTSSILILIFIKPNNEKVFVF